MMRLSRWFHRSITRNVFAVSIVVLAMFALPARQAHAGGAVQVTVTILRFKELQDPDDNILEQSHGEYYGYVNIDNQGYQDGRNLGYGEAHNGADISPYWKFTATVDPNLGTNIPVSIQIKDDDTGVPASVDDVMDINPKSNVRELHLSFNLTNGTWTDTDNSIANVGWSKGNGDTGNFSDGGEQAAVLFDIGFGNGNLSGDGIPDGIKRFGVRDIDSGNQVADMASLGADPCRKTVAIQVDYMSGAADGHTHKPLAGAISLAQNAYNNAPVAAVTPCPYPGFPTQNTGIKLILAPGQAVPELPTMVPDDANFTADKQANFPSALTPYFFYLIMVHDQNASGSPRTVTDAATTSGSPTITSASAAWTAADVGAIVSGAGIPGSSVALPSGTTISSVGPAANTATLSGLATATGAGVTLTITPHTSSSGLSCSGTNRDYIVSLGSWSNETGTASDQGSSIIHELGHCLGLGHGGADGINCKPNYLSVMNYDFQVTGIPSSTGGAARFDYSRVALPSLNESALIETSGIGGDGKDLTAWTPDNGATKISGSTSGALDWNNSGDAGSSATAESVDVNALSGGGCGPVGSTPNTSPGETLNGYDDWNNLKYRGPLVATSGGSGVTHPGVDDITYPQAQAAKAFWATTSLTTTGGTPLSGVEGALIPTSTVATATSTEPSAVASNYTPTIDWGDGVTSPGTISGPPGGPFDVQGSHTYAEEGHFIITTTLKDQGGAKSVASTSADVTDAALTAAGKNIVTLNPFNGAIATFADADPGGTASDYTASIAWGDGTTSAGTVAAGSTGFVVNGSHSFTVLGPETATITITDAGGSTIGTTSTLMVFAFPAYGDFVLGNVTAAGASPTTSVNWWGSQWAKTNVLSSASVTNSFKGFANITTPTSPTCGGSWTTSTGNSPPPPATAPSYMGVTVASKITKSGSAIYAGNIAKIVVVHTLPGYRADPSYPGNGYIVATYCG